MAYTTINKSTDNFNTKLYAGTGSSNAITGLGHQPDLIWLKSRTNAEYHVLYDSVRGSASNYKQLYSNATNAEVTPGTPGLTTIGSDGFTLGTNDNSNNSSENFVSWNWKANGTGSANTDGSINSTVSVNTTAGFSIVKFIGNETSGDTVGHGLGSVPAMIIIKKTSSGSAQDWVVNHKGLANQTQAHLTLNTTNASGNNSTLFDNTAPTSSVFSVGANSATNANGATYVAYCFAEKQGYSKFGSYTGNGSTDGTFVYTGFKPAFIIVKRTNGTANWVLFDNKRSGFNVANDEMTPNLNSAENSGQSYQYVDLLSNGFKWREASNNKNSSNDDFIYMAIGQSLVGSNNVPCTAR